MLLDHGVGLKIIWYSSQKKITNSKTPSEFKLSKEFFSSRTFKMSIFQNHFSPEVHWSTLGGYYWVEHPGTHMVLKIV